MQHTQNTSRFSQLLTGKRALVWIVCILTLLVLSRYALAQDATTPDSGDTAWMLTSTALVLFMTIPGLALFYGGLVRTKNVLSVLMQCFTLTGLVTIIWVLWGYSLAFDTTGMVAEKINLNSFVGDWARCSFVVWTKTVCPVQSLRRFSSPFN